MFGLCLMTFPREHKLRQEHRLRKPSSEQKGWNKEGERKNCEWEDRNIGEKAKNTQKLFDMISRPWCAILMDCLIEFTPTFLHLSYRPAERVELKSQYIKHWRVTCTLWSSRPSPQLVSCDCSLQNKNTATYSPSMDLLPPPVLVSSCKFMIGIFFFSFFTTPVNVLFCVWCVVFNEY